MSIIDALKKLIKNRGGTPVGSNIAEVINNFADDPAPGGGGGEPFIIHGIEDGSVVTMDKTFLEIREALLAGKHPVFIFPPNYGGDPLDRIYTISGTEVRGGEEYFVYVSISFNTEDYYTQSADDYPHYSYD